MHLTTRRWSSAVAVAAAVLGRGSAATVAARVRLAVVRVALVCDAVAVPAVAAAADVDSALGGLFRHLLVNWTI